ncbi:hypothetical protein LOTGIDRAFT_233225 [Lottia gigantea]|uniref:Uncharacterized protein n=1 Tax=Lottia gigantea TaxID=225164 RepID=V4BSX2_LOTGI|nr:hypothetical protein LOTGIDRAFT_233225 [Lottia gigantea]ESO92189.1 hypothetical protein LOTGIDRAFT_233225 [Lottia gigantea]
MRISSTCPTSVGKQAAIDSTCTIQQIQQRCNDTQLCFLCGCEKSNYTSKFYIGCENNDDIILMEPGYSVMREGYTMSYSDFCLVDHYMKCNWYNPPRHSTLKNRIEVYKNCTFKNSCEINIKEGIRTGNKKMVNYPFYCLDKSSVLNISTKIDKNLKNPILYFTGEKYTGQNINCDCSVKSNNPLHLEIFFIHLKPRTCSKVKFFSENLQLFGCSTSGTTMLNTQHVYIGRDFKLEIRGMEPDEEDVLFFRVWDGFMSINCGCTNSTDDGLSTSSQSSMDTTTDIPASRYVATDTATTDILASRYVATYTATSDIPASRYVATDIATTDIPASRYVATDTATTDNPASRPATTDTFMTIDPTLDGPASTAGTDQTNNVATTKIYPILDGSVPATDTNQANSVATVTLGGILSPVILINIVSIALY